MPVIVSQQPFLILNIGAHATYTGGSGGVGITTPGVEAHGFVTYTRAIAEWSVLDLPPSIVAIWYLENNLYYQ